VNSDGADASKPKGIVIGIDKLQIYPVEGATFLGNTDFSSLAAQEKIKSILNGRKVNNVLSDMAPNATGIRSLDTENIMELAFSVLNFARQVSAPDACLLIKVWDNGDVHKLEKAVGEFYSSCKSIKPHSSRSDSAEKFIFGKGFKAL
jgi:23S rRNA (uridine2552-2'-O)-methyltransferase